MLLHQATAPASAEREKPGDSSCIRADDVIKRVGQSTPSSRHEIKRHACICRKLFSRPSALSSHMSVHTGTKPYLCPELGCTRRFSVSSNMKRHMRSHRAPIPSPPPVHETVAAYPSALSTPDPLDYSTPVSAPTTASVYSATSYHPVNCAHTQPPRENEERCSSAWSGPTSGDQTHHPFQSPFSFNVPSPHTSQRRESVPAYAEMTPRLSPSPRLSVSPYPYPHLSAYPPHHKRQDPPDTSYPTPPRTKFTYQHYIPKTPQRAHSPSTRSHPPQLSDSPILALTPLTTNEPLPVGRPPLPRLPSIRRVLHYLPRDRSPDVKVERWSTPYSPPPMRSEIKRWMDDSGRIEGQAGVNVHCSYAATGGSDVMDVSKRGYGRVPKPDWTEAPYAVGRRRFWADTAGTFERRAGSSWEEQATLRESNSGSGWNVESRV